MRLSEAQVRALRVLAAADVIWLRAKFRRTDGHEQPVTTGGYDVLSRLTVAGMLSVTPVVHHSQGRTLRWSITPAGRAALAEHDATARDSPP